MRGRLVGRDDALDGLVAHSRTAGGALLVGSAGVGKTRLLDEVSARLTSPTWCIQRFVASEATRGFAFGALFSLLPSNAPEHRVQALADLRARLLDDAGGRRILLMVDDAHLLDDPSIALVRELSQRGDAVVLLSARIGEAMPTSLTAMWTSGQIDRIEIEPLTSEAVVALAEDVLEGPVTEELGANLAAVSGGNPLLLREVILDALSAGSLASRDGTWDADGMLRSGARVRELVASRTGQLEPFTRAVLELVAVGGPLDLALFDLDEGRVIDRLEALGLVKLEGPAGDHQVRVEHPLIADAISASLSTRRRTEVLGVLANRTIATGFRHHGDALRVARWATEAGHVLDAESACTAAQEALVSFDLELAEDLARRSLERNVTCDAMIVLADANRLRGRTSEARSSVRRAVDLAGTDLQRARCAQIEALLLTHQLGRPGEAVEILQRAANTIADAVLTDRLETTALNLSGLLGAYPDVMETARHALATEDLDDPERFQHLQNVLFSQVMLGRLDDVDDRLEETLELSGRLPEATPEIIDFLWALRTGVYVQRGELAEGERVISEHIDRCRADGSVYIATASIHLQLLLYCGSAALFDLVDDLRAGRAGDDALGVMPIVLGTAALAHVRCGNLDAARQLLAQVPADHSDDRTLPFVASAQAALLAADGDQNGAAEVVVAAGERALETTHVAFGIVALHAGVGYGMAATVAELLTGAAATVDGSLLRAMAEHGTAWRNVDCKALEAAAVSFAEMNARPLAAVALAQAAAVHPPTSVDARRAVARAALWASAAHPFRSVVPAVPEAVSERELDVAWRAAAGTASRDIAAGLYLSVRTVDNHLRNVYRKLDVDGRAGLAEVLAPLPGLAGDLAGVPE